MGQLFVAITALVTSGRYVVSAHAAQRLEDRGLLEWQVVDGVEQGTLMAEHSTARPNPTVEIRQTLADGTQIKAVWAHMRLVNTAKLVTVHYFDE